MKKIDVIIQTPELDESRACPNDGGAAGMIITSPKSFELLNGHNALFRSRESRSEVPPSLKLEVVVPIEKVDDILAAIVDAAHADRLARRPTPGSMASFEALLEDHMAKVVGLMEGAGGGSLHGRVIRLVEKSLLRAVLLQTEGNQVQAARILGIHRNTLREKLKEMKLKAGRFQGGTRRRPTLAKEPFSPEDFSRKVRGG